ncbi:TonB-dependent receptor [Telluribacter sp. SYSU D00476]|uniref:SusC/RagA family TonB-linked outer membrane protein n=1 Tax=Telluribacter sp. SYSU D00476 TaxID=2811430 RepID=UPI001FF4C011|nr:TonB-dependent receptor [Telluribacter sp. SYSU D00476]
MLQRLLMIICFVIGSILSGTAQDRTVSGTVTDETGGGLPGVSVVVKGTSTGTATDVDGKFTLKVPTGGKTLVISYVGMQSQDVEIGNRSTINVTLQSDDRMLEQVVIVGYGVQKKRDLTGSVSSVNTKEMLQANPVNISQGLQGRMAGVMVQKNDGAPGGGVNIQVRGSNSFSSNTQPLYVIDGIPFTSGGGASNSVVGASLDNTSQNSNPLNFLNPQDIESIEVLKDASATAIYGSRGANGVVLITTKKGSGEGRNIVEFTTNVGFSQVSKNIPLMSAHQYAMYMNEGVQNALYYEGRPYDRLPFPGMMMSDTTWVDPVTRTQISRIQNYYLPKPEDFLNGITNTLSGNIPVENFRGTNWQNQIFQVAPSQDYTLSFHGATKDGGYSVSGNYVNQQGIIVNSDFKRYSVRANVYRTFNKWLTLSTNNNLSRSENNSVPTSSGSGSGAGLQGILRTALAYLPTVPVFEPSRNMELNNELAWLMANPYFYTRNMKNQLFSNSIFSSNFAEIQILPNLKFRQNVGFNYSYNDRGMYFGRFLTEGREPRNGLAGKNTSNWFATTFESLFTYDKKFGDHEFVALAGATREQWVSNFLNTSASGFPDDLTKDFNFGRGNQSTYQIQNGQTAGGLMSFLGRANYNYKGKYLATISYRRDGTTAFAANNKWADFFSGALAYRISDEAFIKNLNFFDDLKLRVGYGQTGNQSIGPYQTLDQLQPLNGVVNGVLTPGLVEGYRPGNPNLFWETTNQFNGGIDAAFLNNRFNATLDLYAKKTVDLLTEEQTPPSSGFPVKYKNVGFVTNHGIEASITAHVLPSSSLLQWDLTANISSNRNRIGGLESDQYASNLYYNVREVFLRRNGQPIGVIYGYVTDGFYDNLAEVKADPSKAHLNEASQRELIGEVKYVNLDDDPTSINESDRTIIGNTNPDFLYGINNTFRYKKFTASFFLQGVQGNDILNANLFDMNTGDIRNALEESYTLRWTPENAANAKYPKAWRTERRDRRISDRDIEDGSYLRLKNISLGYTFNNPVKGLSSLYLYVNGNNLWTLTKYSWYDPDVNGLGSGGGRMGVDLNSYPNARSFNFGVRATL